jgi:excisionase family DNA binding protein
MELEKLTYTIDEVTRLLGISRPLAYAMARSGKLPTIRMGRRILVSRKAIERMLEFPDKF